MCPDLVLYDAPCSNPFRSLIPLTPYYSCLLQIIVATSALHLSNASEGRLITPSSNSTYGECQPPLRSNGLAFSQEKSGDSALEAKHRAQGLLNFAIGKMVSEDLDGILATVLLFVHFEIMDSGQTRWNDHIRGAKVLVDMVYRSESKASVPMSILRRCLISNCMVYGNLQQIPHLAANSYVPRYDIFERTFTSSEGQELSVTVFNGALSLLQDDEGNHCSSFPMPLWSLLQNAVQLSKSHDFSEDPAARIASKKHANLLLESVRSFDLHAWAADIQMRSPHSDLAVRTHIASAHKAATCIYIIRVLLTLSPTSRISQDLENLTVKIQIQLSNISPDNSIVAATAWPSFIAGAEANDGAMEDWARNQFQKIWAVQPWGLVKRALAVLRMIRTRRRQYKCSKNAHLSLDVEGEDHWIIYMKRTGVDWLIL